MVAESTGAINQEEDGDDILKEENDTNANDEVDILKEENEEENDASGTNAKVSNQVIHTTARPSIILGRCFVPGSRIQGVTPPIHTYLVRHIEDSDIERSAAKCRTLLKENVLITKRRKQ